MFECPSRHINFLSYRIFDHSGSKILIPCSLSIFPTCGWLVFVLGWVGRTVSFFFGLVTSFFHCSVNESIRKVRCRILRWLLTLHAFFIVLLAFSYSFGFLYVLAWDFINFAHFANFFWGITFSLSVVDAGHLLLIWGGICLEIIFIFLGQYVYPNFVILASERRYIHWKCFLPSICQPIPKST